MKLIVSVLILCQLSFAQITIDPRYDNYDGEALVLKLIEDNQWPAAEYSFEKEKEIFLKRSPADFYLFSGLFSQHKGTNEDSVKMFEKSLSLRYSALALEKVLILYSQKNQYDKGLSLLEKHLHEASGKNLSSEIIFLTAAAAQPAHIVRALSWTESYLNKSFTFSLFKFYTQELVKNKLVHEATQSTEIAFDDGKIKSAEEILTLVEIFLVSGLDQNIHGLLERARIRFPNSDLIKLNLAQVLFKKDLHFSALNLLSELKIDDGVLNVQLELMNLMQVKAYSLFHRMQLQDGSSHLKNWFVYFINNEDWASLYALHTRYTSAPYTSAPWRNDEFSYALAYSSQLMGDSVQARTFIDQVTNPNLSQKKDRLLKSLSL